VYLLHFDEPLAHAQHYLGMAKRLDDRLRAHANGNGSKLMAAVREAGIPVRLARVWRCTGMKRAYMLEYRLKQMHNGRSLCPICDRHARNRGRQ
jgi:predicted GIY-YIG superfamily endonuclease